MRARSIISGFCMLAIVSMPVCVQQDHDILKTLRQEHPRLIFTEEMQKQFVNLAKEDTLLQEMAGTIMYLGGQMMSQPPVEYKVAGPRLLAKSRECLAKVLNLSLAYRLSGELKYAERAIEEMKAAAAFPDWNPSHFLDVAELCAALAIGYDWLYEILQPEDKEQIKTALIEKGLMPGLKVYPDGFAKKINNWNFVCNGGLMMAALAIADEEPALAAEIIDKGLASLPVGMKSYAPEGAWFEGPSYWMYGTNYLAMLLSSLETALGSDLGLSEAPGLARSGSFFLNSIGPAGNFFNYSDCRMEPKGPAPALFWLAKKYDLPEYAIAEIDMLDTAIHILDAYQYGRRGDNYYYRFLPLDITWYHPVNKKVETSEQLSFFFKGLSDVVYFRSSKEKSASFIGFKAGTNGINHGHLDCGTFIFEANGKRWAEDFGSDNYNLPGNWEYEPGGQRWNYFRNSSLSHNVPVINGQNQTEDGTATMIAYNAGDEKSTAVCDLTNAYQGQAESVLRGIALLENGECLVQDEIIGLNADDIYRWALLTSAEIDLKGRKAVLTKENKSLMAEIIEPASGMFTTASTTPTYHPEENPNDGTQLLTVFLPLKPDKKTILVVQLSPVNEAADMTSNSNYTINPLSHWPGYLSSQ